jgi:hypothetical protein
MLRRRSLQESHQSNRCRRQASQGDPRFETPQDLAAPDSASIQIRTRLSARSHKSTTARNLIDPILEVQADWRWQKLKITIDPTGRMTAAYGKQRQSHTFTKANKPALTGLSGRLLGAFRVANAESRQRKE